MSWFSSTNFAGAHVPYRSNAYDGGGTTSGHIMNGEHLNTGPVAEVNPQQRPLFRVEAMQFVATRAYGDVVLTQPISHRVLACVFVALAATIIIFVGSCSTTRKVQCSGVLVPTAGVLRILPGQPGRVVERRVKEGQLVQAGDVLFVLADDRSTASAGSTMQTVSSLLASRRDSLQAELARARQQSLQRFDAAKRRATDIRSGLALLRKQLAIQRGRLALSEQALRQFLELQSRNFLSAAQVQEKQAEVLDQRQRYTDLERSLVAGRRELADIEQEARDIAITAEREGAALARDISAIEQQYAESESRREVLVRAPSAGTITAITGETGQLVSGDFALASLLPSGSTLEAELYVPSSSIGFARPGMRVMLRYQAYPYQKFGQHAAHIREIANTSLMPSELSGAFRAGAEPLYRIRLRLDEQSVRAYGRLMPLKSGMTVDASIVLEERRLYEWILEPLFSISGRL